MSETPLDPRPHGSPSGSRAQTRPSATSRALPNVSIGTVSKALNNRGSLRQETRDKDRSPPRKTRLPAERSRAEPASGAVDDGRHHLQRQFRPFHVPDRGGARAAPVRQGMAVFMCNATDDPARERQHVEQLLGKRVDGLVVTARRADKRAPIEPAARGLPVIYVFSQVESPDALCLLPDDEGGAGLAVRHLAALGRRRIAHVTGPEHFEAVRLRRNGYRKALAEAGLPSGRALLPAGPLVGGMGPRGRRRTLLAPAGRAGRDLLRQRPDRPRRGRRAARDGHRRARTTSRWSASTIGTSWPWRRGRR